MNKCFVVTDEQFRPVICYEDKQLDGKRVASIYLVEMPERTYRVIKYMKKYGTWIEVLKLDYEIYREAENAYQSLTNDFHDPDLDHYYREDGNA